MLIVRIAFCNKRRISEVDELTVTDFEKKDIWARPWKQYRDY